MHFHLPKPPHGWREFVSEILVIVIGISIAIGAEQTVEWVHHRSEVHEAIEKLRAESLSNRDLMTFNLKRMQDQIDQVDRELSVLGTCDSPPAPDKVEPLLPAFWAPLSDTAWLGVRDSALLPLMPDNVVNNYWRLDTLDASILRLSPEFTRSHDDARAAVQVVRRKTRDPEACANATFYLLRLKSVQREMQNLEQAYQFSNEKVLKGGNLDMANLRTLQRALGNTTDGD